jgi:hypothetical protein
LNVIESILIDMISRPILVLLIAVSIMEIISKSYSGFDF